MNEDDPLRQALDALRAADESRCASPHVKAAVFAAFDEWASRASSDLAVTALRAASLFAVAALMALIAVSHLVVSTREGRRPAVVATTSVEPPASAGPLRRPHAETRVNDVPARAPIETAARQGVRPMSQGSTIARGDYGQTVYARIPRSYLPLLGIPMIEPDAEGAVGIEVDIGEDGQHKAIRIVQ